MNARSITRLIIEILLITGFYLIWLKSRNIERKKDYNDRFSRAVEMFGSDKTDIRLGGIFALEQLGKDSSKDRWIITEMFTAFIRVHSPVKENKETTLPPKNNADIQAVLTALGRRIWTFDEMEEQSIDLSKTDLSNFSLKNAYLEAANFSGSDFDGAALQNANLNGTNLVKANLKNAKLKGTRLCGAYLLSSNLEDVNFSAAYLIQAFLSESNLQGANFRFTNLEKAYLLNTNLADADFSNANLSKASLIGAKAGGAIFKDANLSETKFKGTDLRGADLSESKNLVPEQVLEAVFDETTKFPFVIPEPPQE